LPRQSDIIWEDKELSYDFATFDQVFLLKNLKAFTQFVLVQWFLPWGKFTPWDKLHFSRGKFAEPYIAANVNFYESFYLNCKRC